MATEPVGMVAGAGLVEAASMAVLAETETGRLRRPPWLAGCSVEAARETLAVGWVPHGSRTNLPWR